MSRAIYNGLFDIKILKLKRIKVCMSMGEAGNNLKKKKWETTIDRRFFFLCLRMLPL